MPENEVRAALVTLKKDCGWRDGVNTPGMVHFPPFVAQCFILLYFCKLMIFTLQKGVDLLTLAEIRSSSSLQILCNFPNSCSQTRMNGCNFFPSLSFSLPLPPSLFSFLLCFFLSFLFFFLSFFFLSPLFWFDLPFYFIKNNPPLKNNNDNSVTTWLRGVRGSTMLHVILGG